ncbi:MAG TPA: glycosyltransferase family 2 protein [Tepidisphaeraceae bacterium]|jgi:GT2 family glycosyltransferase|nr:glycosyltransferase family 2 protein [Tepidisphaeraceae bacterium]
MTSVALKASIAAVVVTRNRLALLKECVEALRAQTRKPDVIFVIDNASDDGTADWLKGQSDLTVIRQANLGSSGGQYAGVKAAYQAGHDWFWCLDDDTIPHADALERMTACPYFADEWTGFLASMVLWTDGSPHRMNNSDPVAVCDWAHTVLADHCVRLGSSSFVSLLASRRAVAKAGLPLRDMFLWGDDVEFTARIARDFKCYGVLDSIVVHKTPANKNAFFERVPPAEAVKYCFGVRNSLLIARHGGGSIFQRTFRVASLCYYNTKLVLTGRAPVKVLNWIFRGLVFNPPVEHV